MTYRNPKRGFLLLVQAIVCSAFAVALAATPDSLVRRAGRGRGGPESAETVPVARQTAYRVAPLYDDPTVVSDAGLTTVLRKIRPRFSRRQLRPNHVEHALRAWGKDAEFSGLPGDDSNVLSGREMLDVLLNHGRYIRSWNGEADPLLSRNDGGLSVRWGGHDISGSVHHDHLLASLTEAGVSLDETVYPPTGEPMTFGDVLQQALRDFQPDEKEIEWSAMAFGLWLPPTTTSWTNSAGRRITFDLIARRLLRGHPKFGTCSGTHRVYSLVLLYRLDQEFGFLRKSTRGAVRSHLRRMRNLITASQFPDGHWSSNWSEGRSAVTRPISEPHYKSVIATGHHLEWLAIAPPEFHPPREVVRKAARWLVRDVQRKSPEQILAHYTFYSHVGNALCLWRKTRPAAFWTSHKAVRNATGPRSFAERD